MNQGLRPRNEKGNAMSHSFRVGEFARNIESGWLGRIEEIAPPREVKVNDTESFTETMARLVGVDAVCSIVTGQRVMCNDDVQWHSVDDLVHIVPLGQ